MPCSGGMPDRFLVKAKGTDSHSDTTSAKPTKNVELSDICLSDFLNDQITH